MKRQGIIIVLGWACIIGLAGTAGAGTPTRVQDTNHNLSSSGKGTIKATAAGTSEICVFCHTPHSAANIADAPLWNKDIFKNAEPAYTVYSSDVLQQLSYPAAEQPVKTGKGIHIRKTRLCLSCHDGTIALGNLANLPFGSSSDIPMTGGVTTMPQAAAGYIGIDLQDDHPVAIVHTTLDPELKPSLPPAPGGGQVYLFDSVTGVKTTNSSLSTYVECTSCHDPHDNQYGNFLTADNRNSSVCTSCHAKTGYEASGIHATSGLLYAPPNGAGGVLGTTVGSPDGVKCMNCHFPHKAGVTPGAPATPNPTAGKYLLSFQGNGSCFVNPGDRWGTPGSAGVCHGNTASGNNATRRNIETAVGRQYAHPVKSYTNIHKATEGKDYNPNGWLSATPWHVNCEDCHNPHTAGDVLHTVGVNTIGSVGSDLSPLYGAGGARMASWPAAWNPPLAANYTYIEPLGVAKNTSLVPNWEYEVCFKCHTSFAWGPGTPPTSPTLGLPMTDQAKEFNPSNASYHPVAEATKNFNKEGAYLNPWDSGNLTMYCSDCHGSNTTAPVGPHGSTNRAILTNAYDPATIGTVNSELCFKCHNYGAYYSNDVPGQTGFRNATRNLHYWHMNAAGFTNPPGIQKTCTRCHSNPPHGSNKPHLISYSIDGAPYGSYSSITNYNTAALPGSYVEIDCATACH